MNIEQKIKDAESLGTSARTLAAALRIQQKRSISPRKAKVIEQTLRKAEKLSKLSDEVAKLGRQLRSRRAVREAIAQDKRVAASPVQKRQKLIFDLIRLGFFQ